MKKTKIVKKVIGKLIALFLTFAMMGDVMGALTVNAVSEGDAGNVSNQILKGTPVLDGQVDDGYKQSLTLYQGAGVDGAGGVNAYEDDPTAYTDFWNNTAAIYFLCDTDYLYICADVMDDSVESRGLEYVQSDYNGGPWMNDNCEFRLSLDGGNNTIKVGIDAYGLRCYGLTANMEATDYSKILYKTNITDTGYVIEAAIPCSDGGILDLLSAGKLGFKLQMNDYEYDGTYAAFAAEYEGEGPKGLVYYELSADITSGGEVSGGDTELIDYKELSFLSDGNYAIFGSGTPAYGNWEVDEDTGVVAVIYGSEVTSGTAVSGNQTKYMIKPKFDEKGYYEEAYKYMRVLYAAQNPDGVESVDMKLKNDAYGTFITIESGVTDTNGEFVLTDTFGMPDHMVQRYVSNNHMSLMFNTEEEGGRYLIKAFYFFKTEEEANRFVVPADAPDEEPEPIDSKELSFLSSGNYAIFGSGTPAYGNWEIDEDTGVVAVIYGSEVTSGTTASGNQTKYMIKPKFDEKGYYEEAYKYMRVLYAAQNPDGVESVDMKLKNDAYGTFITIESGVTDTNGEFVLTDTFGMPDHMVQRYVSNNHMSLMFNTEEEGGRYLIKAFYFFKTEEEANRFVVPADAPDEEPEPIDYKKLSYLSNGNYAIIGSGTPAYGNWEVDEDTGMVAVIYGSEVTSGSSTPGNQTKYMIKPKFDEKGYYEEAYKYMRVLYAAQNPDGVEAVDMKLRNDGYGSFITIASNIIDTNGEFVLTDSFEMPDHMVQRYVDNNHMSLMFNTEEEGGRYLINAFYFFKTKADADNFDWESERKQVQINGIDISNYKIVIPEKGFGNEYENAKCIMQEIYLICGVRIPIVYDSEAVGDYEILIGNTNRDETQVFYGLGGLLDVTSENYQREFSKYHVRRDGNKLIFVSGVAEGINTGVSVFVKYKLNSESSVINISEEIIDTARLRYQLISWPEVTNVSDPINFVDNFDSNDGYWTTDSDKQGWIFATEGANNIFSSGNNNSALSYLHVFETNVIFEAKLKVAASESGQAGLVLRHTADEAFVKAGYDFDEGGWFIDSREGDDFMCYRLAFTESDIIAGQWYHIKAVVDGKTAELYVNDEKILLTDNLTQLTPGKIGVFADNVSASLDDVDISLLSGQGTIMKNVVHTKLPDEKYFEGGSVWEMNDGSLVYEHYSTLTYVSNDSGKTWTSSQPWLKDTHGYPNILRLENGDFLHIVTQNVDGVTMWGSRTSSDEGKTWTNGGVICRQNTYLADGTIKMNAGNMNDKVTQMSDGRIFYVQTMNTSTAAATYGYPRVWCDVYYSDDNGVNWTKSETSTYEMAGNDLSIRIGEAKVLETADGKLRLYSSWNDYGCIVYSESSDNGVTWGPIQKMEEYVCSKSSMQFAKDNYADNETTYYMVWIKNDTTDDPEESQASFPRSHLVLEKSVDGINWTYLGDIWRWESKYYSNSADIQHLVDPFITVTEDYLVVGSGISEKVDTAYAHHAQREHIYSVRKDTLETEEGSGSENNGS